MEIAIYPKRLIEVDLPIARISAHARREKSIRHGHISTLHIWWARRPLAACRAVICASLWPDPVDLTAWTERGGEISVGDSSVVIQPQRFLDTARERMTAWANQHLGKVSKESYPRFVAIQNGAKTLADPLDLQRALLDFIADFANWDNSTDKDYLETARALTQAAHEALGGEPETRPLVVDPFAGGGSIPLEALRVGADAFASDLNPVAVLLNKVVLEYIPKYGQRLADEVRKWGAWIKQEAEKELAEFYPKDPDGATPIAYLWVRTIQCEGPGCGAEVPLLKSMWVANKKNRSVALHVAPDKIAKRVNLQLIIKQNGGWVEQENGEIKIENPVLEGIVKRGSATCPCCGYTVPADRVREQLSKRSGGSKDARMTVVVRNHPSLGTIYSIPSIKDLMAARRATDRLHVLGEEVKLNGFSFSPDEPTPTNQSHRSVASLWIYGMHEWRDIYTDRQMLVLGTLCRTVAKAEKQGLSPAAQILFSLCIGKIAGFLSTLCLWRTARTCVANTFARQALPIVWDFGEMNPFAGSAGDWSETVEYLKLFIEAVSASITHGENTSSEQADSTDHQLPSDSVELLATDPPYYDSVVYGELSDYFYVWLKRIVPAEISSSFKSQLTPKDRQAVVYHPNSAVERKKYELLMCDALAEAHRVVKPAGVGVVVFAHKSTAGWETMLQAIIGAGWIVSASWPVDTEREGRPNANKTASLASSVHLVCRPRKNPDGSIRESTGDWRDVLSELPQRIHSWMPRLAEEGVVGADAIFACLGPALEVFSRYSRVEKSSGETVTLKEYLEHVWAAVSKEALSMIFKDPDTAGLEPDARLTAMWLWTLGASSSAGANDAAETEDEDVDEESGKAAKVSGFTLEFDAARKIAQGLGVHLEKSPSVVEVKGDTAKLLSVAERVKYLFGKDAETTVAGKTPRKKKKEPVQQSLFAELQAAESAAQAEWGDVKGPKPGTTVLDRLHQAMILFAAGRGEAMKRFIVEEGIGNDARFWKLAQSLTALYPGGSDEKRWVDGVLARKKGLGF